VRLMLLRWGPLEWVLCFLVACCWKKLAHLLPWLPAGLSLRVGRSVADQKWLAKLMLLRWGPLDWVLGILVACWWMKLPHLVACCWMKLPHLLPWLPAGLSLQVGRSAADQKWLAKLMVLR